MTGAILAGGRSRRMGFNKAFIRLPGGRSIIERTVALFTGLFEKTIIVADDVEAYEGLGPPVFPDAITGAGSIGGVYTALLSSETDWVFVAACDMPGLDSSVIEKIVSASLDESPPPADAVIPFIEGRYHPMHAAYSKRSVPVMEEMIKSGELRLSELIKRIRVRRLEEDSFAGLPARASVQNLNTPEELRLAGAMGPEEPGR